MIQLQVCFCLLGLALAALGVAMLLRPQRLRRFLRLLGSVLFLVLLAALLLRALY